jgi:ATP-dependent helicase/nuclease subunit A
LNLLPGRLNWRYSFEAATREPAKTSATIIRRRAEEASEDDPVAMLFQSRARIGPGRTAETAAESGLAHHAFLQHVQIARTSGIRELKAEAARLEAEGRLTRKQATSLEFDALTAFWNSEQGRFVRKHPELTRRELEFTTRFSPAEIATLTGMPPGPHLENEFVIVQGIADLVVTLPRELYLVDFKTDAISEKELESRAAAYRPQLKIYASALSRIYGRPVTAAWLWFLAPRKAVSMRVQMHQAAFEFYELPSSTSVS